MTDPKLGREWLDFRKKNKIFAKVLIGKSNVHFPTADSVS